MTSDFSQMQVYIGMGYGLIAPSAEPKPVSPEREYVAGQRGIIRANAKQALSQSIDELTRQYGWQVYESMLTDPVITACFDIIRLGVLNGDMTFPPTHPKSDPMDADTPETLRSQEIADFCERLSHSTDRPLVAILWEFMEAFAFGNKLAEKVYRLETVGTDKDRYVYDKIKFKPRWTYLLVTDGRFNVLSVMAWTADEVGVTVLPRSKFAFFVNNMRDSDPRGTSDFRPAFEAWNRKVLRWPQWTKFVARFGTPKPIGKTAEGAKPGPPLNAQGKPIVGAQAISPQELLAGSLSTWCDEDQAIAVPAGTEVDLMEPTTEGEIFVKATEMDDRQMALALLKNTRTLLEAKHGSRADSDTATDVTQLSIDLKKKLVCEMWRREILLDNVSKNFGDEDAHKYTPMPVLGLGKTEDIKTLAEAYTKLRLAGMIPDQLIPRLLEKMGIKLPSDFTADFDQVGSGDEAVADEAEDKVERDEQASKRTVQEAGDQIPGDGGTKAIPKKRVKPKPFKLKSTPIPK